VPIDPNYYAALAIEINRVRGLSMSTAA